MAIELEQLNFGHGLGHTCFFPRSFVQLARQQNLSRAGVVGLYLHVRSLIPTPPIYICDSLGTTVRHRTNQCIRWVLPGLAADYKQLLFP